MFTGLVEATGKLVARTPRGPGARLVIAAPLEGALELGESISVGGCCLTVDAVTKDGFEADASAETLAKTTLGGLAVGSRVNLERALRLDSRLGGHIVSGHVDGVGSLVSREPLGDAERVVFRAPEELMRFIAPKGSIAVDGVSLTVNEVKGETFEVALIPRTQNETSLRDIAPGGAVNLEIDLLARYVLRLMQAPAPAQERDASLLEVLRKNGYM